MCFNPKFFYCTKSGSGFSFKRSTITKLALSIFLILGLVNISSAQIFGPPNPDGTGQTYAIVVGVTEYQNPNIPDLKFADKDAFAFANFLRTEAGGNVDVNNIKLFTNEEALKTDVMQAIYSWVSDAKPGNRYVFYFSGHGDVDRVDTENNSGYLLCHDAPNGMYELTGCIAVPVLEEKILAVTDKGAEVVLIIDACRSGKLLGNNLGGSAKTMTRIMTSFNNTIKFLSCLPEQKSTEGTRWGGGRGAFSYYLVNGLYGLADGHKEHERDFTVKFRELRDYVEDHVEKDLENQTPKIEASRNDDFTTVYPELRELAETNNLKWDLLRSSADPLAGSDDESITNYTNFETALVNQQFLEPKESCADTFYKKLIANASLDTLHEDLTKKYISALQNFANKYVNEFIKSDLTENTATKSGNKSIYKKCAIYLERAYELLESNSIKNPDVYKDLQNEILTTKYFFEGKAADSVEEQQSSFKKALAINPKLAPSLLEIIQTFKTTEADSAEYYATKANELRPKWIMPTLRLHSYYEPFDSLKALSMLERAAKINPKAPFFWWTKAQAYEKRKDYNTAIKFYALVDSLKMAGADAVGVDDQLRFRMGNCYHQKGFYELAIAQYNRVETTPADKVTYYKKQKNLARSYYQWAKSENNDEAKLKLARDHGINALDVNDNYLSMNHLMGYIYRALGKNGAAQDYLKAEWKLDDEDGWSVKPE